MLDEYETLTTNYTSARTFLLGSFDRIENHPYRPDLIPSEDLDAYLDEWITLAAAMGSAIKEVCFVAGRVGLSTDSTTSLSAIVPDKHAIHDRFKVNAARDCLYAIDPHVHAAIERAKDTSGWPDFGDILDKWYLKRASDLTRMIDAENIGTTKKGKGRRLNPEDVLRVEREHPELLDPAKTPTPGPETKIYLCIDPNCKHEQPLPGLCNGCRQAPTRLKR